MTREHKGAGHTLAALRSIRATRPGGYRLFVIMDDLAANKTPRDPPLGEAGECRVVPHACERVVG